MTDPKRATGRTTGLMLQAIGKAVENPGTEVEFIDHHEQNHAQLQLCKTKIELLAKTLNLDVSVDLRLKENIVDFGLFVKSNWVSPYAQRTPAEEKWNEIYGYYELDDIKQESYIICLEALSKYDKSRPFENFISKHLSNRLKTLIRDKYSRSNIESEKHGKLNQNKKNLMDLKSGEGQHKICEEDILERMSTDEAIEILMRELPPSMRNNFYRLANGVSIQSSKKNALFEKVKEILGENW